MYDDLVKRLRICPDYNDGCVNCQHEHDLGCRTTTMREAADAIEGLSNAVDKMTEWRKNPWIPVTERLPKDQRPVLVYVPPYTDGEEEYVGYVGMAYFTYSPNGGFWCGTDGNIYGAIGIIHEPLTWMPLPEPPKEE